MTSLDEHRAAVVAACHHLAGRGLSPGGSGNLSVRAGDQLVLTPGGSSFSRARAEQLAVLSLSGEHVDGPRPTKEWELHQLVYRARPDARAIVHLHSHFAVAASCLEPLRDDLATGPLPALTPYQVMRLGALPIVPYARPGSTKLAVAAADAARTQSVLLLANHGSLAIAAELDTALDLAEELEAAARLFFTLAATPHRRLTESQVHELRG